VLAWEARRDAIASGVETLNPAEMEKEPEPEKWQPDRALSADRIHAQAPVVGPLGSMS
jgi:hypothetical protein